MIRLRLTMLLFLYLCWGRILSAEAESLKVVVVLYAEEDEGAVRLQAELKALGYQPEMIVHPPKSLTSMEALSSIRFHNGIALINITMKRKGVEIWISGNRTGSGTLVDTIAVEDGHEIDAATILKSVESLRASLMRFDHMETTKADASKTAVAQGTTDHGAELDDEASEGHGPGVGAEIGFSTVYGFGALTPPLCFSPSLVLHLSDWLAADVGFMLSVYQMEAENRQGSADVWYWGAGLGLRGYILGRESIASPWLGASIGPTLLRIKGTAKEANTSHKDLLVTGMVYMRVGVDVKLTDRLALQLVLLNGWSMVRIPAVRLGDEAVRFGNPLLGGTLSVVVNLI